MVSYIYLPLGNIIRDIFHSYQAFFLSRYLPLSISVPYHFYHCCCYSQMPQIIQNAVKAINSTFVSIRCWSTLPDWDKERWMEVHPSKHLVLINGNTYQNSWYEGDTHISYKYPKALAERWRNYFNNQMVGSKLLPQQQKSFREAHFTAEIPSLSQVLGIVS